MAYSTLASVARSGLKTLGLISVSAGLSAAIVLQKIEQETAVSAAATIPVQDIIRVRHIEVVDDNGDACVLLYGGTTGGVIEWRRPGRKVKGADAPTFASIGSYFPGYADFWFSDPTGNSSVGINMSIGGMPQSAVLMMNGLNDKQILRLDTWPLRPTVTVTHPGDGAVKFQK